jgi:hypothetical protein
MEHLERASTLCRYDPPLSTLNSLAKALRIKVEDLVR